MNITFSSKGSGYPLISAYVCHKYQRKPRRRTSTREEPTRRTQNPSSPAPEEAPRGCPASGLRAAPAEQPPQSLRRPPRPHEAPARPPPSPDTPCGVAGKKQRASPLTSAPHSTARADATPRACMTGSSCKRTRHSQPISSRHAHSAVRPLAIGGARRLETAGGGRLCPSRGARASWPREGGLDVLMARSPRCALIRK